MTATPSMIVMGASAGAVEALSAILPRLPATFEPPIAIVVHMGPDDPGLLPQLFAAKCELKVKQSEDKEPLRNRTIYFAPPDYHLLVERHGAFALSRDEPVRFSRPSIDVLFESAADAYRDRVCAVVLTGANDDGAEGARRIERNGGIVLAQAPHSAYSSMMPASAIAACRAARSLHLDEISTELLRFGGASGDEHP